MESNKKSFKQSFFGLFKKKSEIQVLQSKFEKLMKESYELSTVNRTSSDKKFSEADEISKKIDELKKKELKKN